MKIPIKNPYMGKYQNQLIVPKRPNNYNNYGDRAFENAVPKLWNDLPVDIRIKTHSAPSKRC